MGRRVLDHEKRESKPDGEKPDHLGPLVESQIALLGRLSGDLVVLIHSDRDCANVLPKTRGRIRSHHPYKFLCTNLTEDEMVTGQGNRKLRRSIELVHEQWHPELIVVLSTCPTVMIGDNIKQITRKTAKKLGIRAVARLTHGLKSNGPWPMGCQGPWA